MFFGTAQTFGTNPYAVTLNLSGSAPTLTTQGIKMDGYGAVRVRLSATTGNTLSGSGSLQAYIYDYSLARWARYPEGDITVTTSGVRDLIFDSKEIGVASGLLYYNTSSITVSGGTTVVVGIQMYSVGPRGK